MFKSLLMIGNYEKNIRYSFLINFIVTFVMQGIFNVFIGIYIKTLGYGEGVVGKILSINSLAVAIGSVFMAYLMMHFTRKSSIIAGIICIAVGIFGISFFNSVGALMLFAALIGIGSGFPSTAMGVLLMESSTPEQRVDIFSANFILQSLGAVLGSFIGGKISWFLSLKYSSLESIHTLFFISATILLLTIFPISKIQEKKNKGNRKKINFISGTKKILSGKSLGFLAYNTVIGFGAGLVVPFFSVYLKFALNVSDAWVGSIMALSQVGLVIGGLLVPHVSKRLGKVKTILVCQLLSIPFLISIAFPTGLTVVAISFLMRSTLMNLNQPLVQNIAMEVVDEDLRPIMSSLTTVTGNFTRALSVLISGHIMEKFSYNAPYYFTVLLYLTGTYIFYKYFFSMNKKEF